ncbi:MAG: phosphoribosyltransferase family protein [Symbiobacterium sp.]|uniref:ComF family protein n=1 Tax=Symbiobacterium sp. TaxID=1971213 RepID=UPI003464000F
MWKTVVEGLVTLLWPQRSTCVTCGGPLAYTLPPLATIAETVPVCDHCWAAMPFGPDVRLCANCSRPITGGWGLCVECVEPPPFGRVWALGLHRGALRTAVHHAKFRGRQALARALGERLAARVTDPPEVIIPIPLHTSRQRERGYNQAACIAHGLAAQLGVPVAEGDLVRLRRTGEQTRRDRQARWQNLAGAFGVRGGRVPAWAGRDALLVDDVLTTGATAAAAARVLRATGARSVSLAVVAVSDKPIPASRIFAG